MDVRQHSTAPHVQMSHEAASQLTPACPPGQTGERCTAWEAPSPACSQARGPWPHMTTYAPCPPDNVMWANRPRDKDERGTMRSLGTARQPPVAGAAFGVGGRPGKAASFVSEKDRKTPFHGVHEAIRPASCSSFQLKLKGVGGQRHTQRCPPSWSALHLLKGSVNPRAHPE